MSQREIYTADNLSYFDLHEFQFTGFSWSCMECTNLHQNFFSFSLSLSNRYIPLSFIYLEFFLSYQCFTIHRIQGRQVQCRYSRIMLNYLISWQDYYIMHVRFFREGIRLYSQTKAMPLKHGEKTHNACNNCNKLANFHITATYKYGKLLTFIRQNNKSKKAPWMKCSRLWRKAVFTFNRTHHDLSLKKGGGVD